MENIKVEACIGNHVYKNGIEMHGTVYEEFIRWRPNYNGLGESWFSIFDDAVRSLVLNTESLQSNDLHMKVDDIVKAANKYARIYMASPVDCRDRALYMLHGVLQDIVRDYQYRDTRYDTLVQGLYEKISALVKV